ncbi:1-phosphatidylinositol 4,5-bisphosphate phosphodiesterase epsilon-1 isoform X5, partial [Tachysurus ichikawai]
VLAEAHLAQKASDQQPSGVVRQSFEDPTSRLSSSKQAEGRLQYDFTALNADVHLLHPSRKLLARAVAWLPACVQHTEYRACSCRTSLAAHLSGALLEATAAIATTHMFKVDSPHCFVVLPDVCTTDLPVHHDK